MEDILLQAKSRICTLSSLTRWLPYSIHGNIAEAVGKGYYNSKVKVANNAKFALLTKEIYAQLSKSLSEAADDVSKFAVEVFVKFSIEPRRGALLTIHSFQVNLYRVVSTLGGAPQPEAELTRFLIHFVGSKEDSLIVPPWKAVLIPLKPQLSMVAKVEIHYAEDGLPDGISEKIGKKELPVLIIGDSVFEALITVKGKKAIPTLIVNQRKKSFSGRDALKDFLTERIEPSLSFVRSRSGHVSVDREVRRFGRALDSVLEDRRIKEPSTLPIIQSAIKEAEVKVGEYDAKKLSLEDQEKLEKAKKALDGAKDSFKELRIALKTVNGDLATLERNHRDNVVSYPIYSSENTKFLMRKFTVESNLTDLVETLNEKVLSPLKSIR